MGAEGRGRGVPGECAGSLNGQKGGKEAQGEKAREPGVQRVGAGTWAEEAVSWWGQADDHSLCLQIGSYFGASLCSVDVDRDGNTDLVLIGAPHYYEQTRGGRVFVCPLPKGVSGSKDLPWFEAKCLPGHSLDIGFIQQRAVWQCQAILRGEQGHPWSCFGAALTVLGDVNGDELTDVAIGAPGEQENQGAVYLFHGTRGLDISPTYSQVGHHLCHCTASPLLRPALPTASWPLPCFLPCA